MTKKALITGITGQDGSYLAELLLSKGYDVFGIVRRSSSFNTGRIDHLIEGFQSDRFEFSRGDVNDVNSLIETLNEVQPEEIYHLAAQSHVMVSFEMPVYSFDTVATGSLRLLETIRSLKLKCRIYLAGSSEMFGSSPPPQNEDTPFCPRSPYAVAKVSAHQLGQIYREAYGLWISRGILFNHESPRRGETFVTRKITRALARMKLGLQDRLLLGNINAFRDWGYAVDYVEAMWQMLQQNEADDYVIATGEMHSVREFADMAFKYGGINLKWEGQGLEEKGIDTKTGKILIEISPRYFRPLETESLQGDPTKARQKLGWKPTHKFNQIVQIMVDADIKREKMLLEGTKLFNEMWRTHI